MPWFAVAELKPYISAFASKTDVEIKTAIQKGANRLLSMQTRGGGLAYWPGGTAAQDWATCYGGHALILAKLQGAKIPQEAMDGIAKYLSNHLRIMIDRNDTWNYQSAARSLYTLALMNKAKQSDLNFLFERKEKLDDTARSYLAMAMHKLNPDSEDAKALVLNPNNELKHDKAHWMRFSTNSQARLLALSIVAPENSATHSLLNQIVQKSGKNGHWGNTWANAATVNAMAAYAKSLKETKKVTTIALIIDGKKRYIDVSAKDPMKMINVPLHGAISIEGTSKHIAFCNVLVSSKPKIVKAGASSNNGVAIAKKYYRILSNGSREKLENPKVGDLVEVELEVTFANALNYVVIDDPLPTTFECVNSAFASQSTHVKGSADKDYTVSHQELRDDRALFFLNRSWNKTSKKLSYLARITSSGEVAAPPAKVEAMYDPDTYGLSGTDRFICSER